MTNEEIEAHAAQQLEPLSHGRWKHKGGGLWALGSRLYVRRVEVDDGQQGRPMGWARTPQYVYRWDLALDDEVVGHYSGLVEAMAAASSLVVLV